ncbi:MAG: histidine phosphatase family protein [Candidatus Thermoplasmatota archaeon]|nr:histidine phosphatase family protein [Candidatus Thermoplasmatota archaeon]MCL5955404.1 histidine phosphatase family protein [Candidatus Thermoplasmatota archaeon]
MAKLYIIRHAETEINPAISSTEWKLKPAAQNSLLKMSKEIGLRGVDCIFHSPLRKAKATAAILGEICSVSLIVRQCLKGVERHFDFIEQ